MSAVIKRIPLQMTFDSQRSRVLFEQAARRIKGLSSSEYLRLLAAQAVDEFLHNFGEPENLEELIKAKTDASK